MANRRRDLAKERLWRAAVARHAASGLSVRVFCRREQLGEASFYAWRRTIGARDRAAKRAAFVPVVVHAARPELTPPQPATLAIELRGGRTLRLPARISPTRLARIVRALEAEVPAPGAGAAR